MKKLLALLMLCCSQQLAANTCPASIAGYNFVGERDGHKYFVSEANFNHGNATAAAAAQGGYMASITSADENDFLRTRISTIAHIGFNDQATEGTFAWPSGEVVGFNNLEVANSGQKDYANMNFWNGGWGLDGLWTARPYILEIPCDAGNGGTADVSLSSFRNLQVVPPGAPTLINADMTISNNGTIAATFELRTYLSTDNVLSADDVRLSRSDQTAGAPQIITLNCCFTNSEVGGVYSIPGGLTSGNYFFIAVLDEDNQVNGVGGTLARQVTIDPAPSASLPDLFFNVIIFEQPVTSPSSVQINYTIGNSGNGDANGSFNVEFYLSPNDFTPANDVLLATRTVSGGIPRGGESSGSVVVDVPANLSAGEYRFVVIADSENQIPEQSESNNAIRIFDLIEGDDSGSGGGNECPGTIAGFSIMGELGGSKYYLSSDTANWTAASDSTNPHQGYLASINNAAENTFLKERIDEIVLIGLSDKDSENTFVWDSGEGLTYSNITGNNNSSRNDYANMNFWNGGWDFDNELVSRRYIMEVPCDGDSGSGGGDKPDLNVSNISAVPNGVAGEVLRFTFDLNNFEPVVASESYRIGMYLSDDSNLSSDDALVGEVPTGNTPEGTIAAVPGAITVPFGTNPGAYFLIIKADIENAVDESNENNNVVSRTFNVNTGQLSGIDLELSMSVDKPVLKAWTNYTFTITAFNRGPERATNISIDFNRNQPSQMPFVEVNASKGSSAGWSGNWDDLDLNAGESATLEVTYFFKNQTTTSSLFAHVVSADQDDTDSTFANGQNIDFIVNEDDEAIANVVGSVASCGAANQLFAFVGQSNMSGQGERTEAPIPLAGTAFEYHIQTDSIIPLEASTGEWWGLPSTNNHKLSAASSGSLLPAFAKNFNALTGKKLTAIHAARGGAGWFYEFADFGNWQPGGQTMTAALHKIDAGINRSGLPLTGIVFLGGETDTVTNFGNNFVEADFKEGMRTVMRTFRQKYNAPLYFILPGWTTGEADQFKDPKTLEARDMMVEVYNEAEFSSFTRVIHTTTIDIRNLLSEDGIHYTQAGYNSIGNKAAENLTQQQICVD